MTRALLIALLLGSAAFWPACVQLGPNDGEGGAVSTACDGRADCNACSNCARQDACASEEAACQNNSACVGLNECLLICSGDQMCEADCFDANPGGIVAYDALLACVICDACPSDCRGLAQCSN